MMLLKVLLFIRVKVWVVTCSWCGDIKQIDFNGYSGSSHGICEKCRHRYFPRWKRSGINGTAAA